MPNKPSSKPKRASTKILKNKLQSYKRTAMGGWRKVYKKAAAELYRETGS